MRSAVDLFGREGALTAERVVAQQPVGDAALPLGAPIAAPGAPNPHPAQLRHIGRRNPAKLEEDRSEGLNGDQAVQAFSMRSSAQARAAAQLRPVR